MFDIGSFEILLIAIIGLIVVGPERMPAIARKLGKLAGRAKKFIDKSKEAINEEIEVDKLKEDLSLQNEALNIGDVLSETKEAINSAGSEVSKTINNVQSEESDSSTDNKHKTEK